MKRLEYLTRDAPEDYLPAVIVYHFLLLVAAFVQCFTIVHILAEIPAIWRRWVRGRWPDCLQRAWCDVFLFIGIFWIHHYIYFLFVNWILMIEDDMRWSFFASVPILMIPTDMLNGTKRSDQTRAFLVVLLWLFICVHGLHMLCKSIARDLIDLSYHMAGWEGQHP